MFSNGKIINNNYNRNNSNIKIIIKIFKRVFFLKQIINIIIFIIPFQQLMGNKVVYNNENFKEEL